MAQQIMGLGPFRFAVTQTPLVGVNRRIPSRHGPVPVQGRRPSLHFMGPDVEEVRLEGIVYDKFFNGNGLKQLEGMKRAVGDGSVHTLAAADGQIYGRFVLKELSEERTYLDPRGSPLKVEFGLLLQHYQGGVAGGSGFGNIFGAAQSVVRLFGGL